MGTQLKTPRQPARARKVMLVEDSELVLMSLEALFEDMEWDIDGPVKRFADAMLLADTTDADVALLDVNLNGEMSWPVAERLEARGIPVIFATGYGDISTMPEHLKSLPLVGKPFAISDLEALLKELVGDG